MNKRRYDGLADAESKMTPQEIAAAKQLSAQCIESDYRECNQR